MFEEPRELLNIVCEDFREMYPNRTENYCCTGGGGAMSMSEYAPQRLKSAQIKADQLRATGAKIVVTSCHNCVDGLTDLIKHYDLGMEVKQLVDMVYSALVVPKPTELEEAVPVAAAAPGSTPEKALAGYKVLVIDDEPDIRTYLKMIFRERGAQVIEAHDANQGFRQIRDEKPDLVTLDLIMPHKTGEKLYWELRKDEKYKELPIMIITGYAKLDKPTINFQEFIAEKGIPEPNAFLEKPIDPEKTIDTAIQVLAERIPVKEVQ
jgi:CheY-like chemotaxis protein